MVPNISQNSSRLLEKCTARSEVVEKAPATQFRIPLSIPSMKSIATATMNNPIAITNSPFNRGDGSSLINYNRRGWNLQEPFDDEEKMEEPRLVRKAFEVVIESGNVLRSQISSDLPFNMEDVEELANLPHGYLDEDSAYNWAIKTLSEGFPPQP